MANCYLSSGKYALVTQWAALTTYSSGNIRRQLAAPSVGNERCFRVSAITTGISGASEPSWNLGAGATTTDAGVTWTECTGVANQNGDGGGSAWAAPHARLGTAFGSGFSSSGDNIYVGHTHAETQATAISLTAPANTSSAGSPPTSVICVNEGTVPPTTLATSATISTTGANNIGWTGGFFSNPSYAYYYGITFQAGSAGNSASIVMTNDNFSNQVMGIFENCTFKLNNTNTGSLLIIGGGLSNSQSPFFTGKFNGCSFIFGATAQQILLIGNTYTTFTACSFAPSGSVPTTLFNSGGAVLGAPIVFRGCDMSPVTGTLFSGGLTTTAYLENCKLGASVVIVGTVNVLAAGIHLHNCDSSGTNYRYYHALFQGTAQSETTVVRTGGASDLTTGLSWNVTTGTGASFTGPFITEETEVWNDATGGSLTLTIFLTSNSSLNNNDVWMDVEYPSASGNPQSAIVSTRMTPLGTPAALTSDSSTWGGSISNKYKLQGSFTPLMKGPVKVRVFVAKASTTVYVDPRPILSGVTVSRSFFVPGWGYVNNVDVSAGGGGVSGPIICSGGI